MHEAALLSFSHVFGQVRSTQELIQFLESAMVEWTATARMSSSSD